jgi:hypothetical protein
LTVAASNTSRYSSRVAASVDAVVSIVGGRCAVAAELVARCVRTMSSGRFVSSAGRTTRRTGRPARFAASRRSHASGCPTGGQSEGAASEALSASAVPRTTSRMQFPAPRSSAAGAAAIRTVFVRVVRPRVRSCRSSVRRCVPPATDLGARGRAAPAGSAVSCRRVAPSTTYLSAGTAGRARRGRAQTAATTARSNGRGRSVPSVGAATGTSAAIQRPVPRVASTSRSSASVKLVRASARRAPGSTSTIGADHVVSPVT